MHFNSGAGRIAAAIMKAADLGEVDPQILEQALSEDQITQAVDTLTRTDDPFVAARGLTTFVESSGSEHALERAFQRYQDIPDTRDFWYTRWGSCPIEEATPFIKTAYLGQDIGMAFAKLGLHEQASSVSRWAAEHQGEQIAVNIVAYTLSDTVYPDTVRWCMEELLHIMSRYPHGNTEFFADKLTENRPN